MHNGNWNDHMDGGGWWWIPMTALMVLVVGGLVWLIVVLARGGHAHGAALVGPAGGAAMSQVPTTATPMPGRPTAQDILAERLARGEIEPDDYRRRLDALNGTVTS
jgi:putative membrane protein